MKKAIQICFIMLWSLCGFSPIHADTPIAPDASQSTKIPHAIVIRRVPRLPTDPLPDRPTSLSVNTVEVWYDYEEMTITFKEDEGDCTVVVYNDVIGTTKRYCISTTNFSTSSLGRMVVNDTSFSVSCKDWLRHTISLIGEPELEMWLGKPKDLKVTVSASGQNLNYSSAAASSKSVLYDFSTSRIIRGTSGRFTRPTGDYIISVWTPGYLPLLRYYGVGGTLTKTHDVFTTDAVLGGDNANEFVIGYTGVLNLSCTEMISGNGGVTRIKGGGTANLSSYKNCTLSQMTVEYGGKLNVNAMREVTITDCTFEAGSEVVLGK